MLLQGWLARVGSFLERVKVALCRLSLVPAMSQTTLTSHPPGVANVGSTKESGGELYRCFSPHVGDISSPLSALSPTLPTTEGEFIAMLEAPVLQIMPSFENYVCIVLRLCLWSIWRWTHQ